ncbi:MAG: hypothetical protein J5501_08430 [Ruminococcus sp.]|nr:hypothetical protein [Ruminococcus sp.]
MDNCILASPSYTYAVKAARLLRSRGIACEMRRSEAVSRSGCGWELLIRSDCRRAAGLLEHSRIPYSVPPQEEGAP